MGYFFFNFPEILQETAGIKLPREICCSRTGWVQRVKDPDNFFFLVEISWTLFCFYVGNFQIYTPLQMENFAMTFLILMLMYIVVLNVVDFINNFWLIVKKYTNFSHLAILWYRTQMWIDELKNYYQKNYYRAGLICLVLGSNTSCSVAAPGFFPRDGQSEASIYTRVSLVTQQWCNQRDMVATLFVLHFYRLPS